MKSNKMVLIVFLLCVVINHAMENNVMVKIKAEKDLIPFVGKVVAYTTESYALGKEGGYVLYNNPAIKYAYIEDKGHRNRQMLNIYDEVRYVHEVFPWAEKFDHFYKFHQLLNKRGDMPGSRYIDEKELHWALLELREIRQEEGESILDAVRNKEARFESLNEKFNLFKVILQTLENKNQK